MRMVATQNMFTFCITGMPSRFQIRSALKLQLYSPVGHWQCIQQSSYASQWLKESGVGVYGGGTLQSHAAWESPTSQWPLKMRLHERFSSPLWCLDHPNIATPLQYLPLPPDIQLRGLPPTCTCTLSCPTIPLLRQWHHGMSFSPMTLFPCSFVCVGAKKYLWVLLIQFVDGSNYSNHPIIWIPPFSKKNTKRGRSMHMHA